MRIAFAVVMMTREKARMCQYDRGGTEIEVGQISTRSVSAEVKLRWFALRGA